MKRTLLIIAAAICVAFTTGCDGGDQSGEDLKVSFAYQPAADDANTIEFTATPEGKYSLLEWILPGNEVVKNELTCEYYFPKRGEYQVTVKIWENGKSASDTQKIVIAQDDPNYEGPRLIWSDEFDGNSLNEQNWTAETGVKVNNELQEYTTGNHVVRDGKLIITAEKVNENKQYGSYTSGRIVSSGKREFTYGRMEIRAKLPTGLGTWPAIWMLGKSIMHGTNWPACGEIDIMEYVGYDPHVIHGSLHSQANNHTINTQLTGKTTLATKDEDEFHVYGLNWTADKIEFYVDDRNAPFYTVKAQSPKTQANWPFDEPFFFILNVAIGGDWGGVKGIDNSIFPVSMEIDYVRVYEND